LLPVTALSGHPWHFKACAVCGYRDHWLAWDGDLVVGALHSWQSPDGRLRLLDCAIRADIPGADGWQPDPIELHRKRP
jgi:hypothetical protein